MLYRHDLGYIFITVQRVKIIIIVINNNKDVLLNRIKNEDICCNFPAQPRPLSNLVPLFRFTLLPKRCAEDKFGSDSNIGLIVVFRF